MIVYDTECYPDVWTIGCENLEDDTYHVFEISRYQDDRIALYHYFCYLQQWQIPMIGFNNIHYDYPMIHFVWNNLQSLTAADIYNKNQSIFASQNRFGEQIYQRDRFAPQIDLFKIHHFDNEAKSTSLKALEINMRLTMVKDLPFAPGSTLSKLDVDMVLKPYMRHDIRATKAFAKISRKMIKLRQELSATIRGDVMNFNDTKIGSEYLIQRLGDVCWTKTPEGRKQPRQTWHNHIDLSTVIFPYIRFEHPEFRRVHAWLLQQKITETKGVFENLTAFVGNVTFHFGTGGMHGSVDRKAYRSDANYQIVDIDVAGLYPAISNANQLAPDHLGQTYVTEFADIPRRRAQYSKGTPENAMYKLAANAAIGKTNSDFGPLRDPRYNMRITINGQLLICMLAERLVKVPTFELIQINTDGITYKIHRAFMDYAAAICKEWEAFTFLTLETVLYNRMWIRDVNNYIAEKTDGKLKQKGAYFAPRTAEEIQAESPPAWHKDFSNLVSVRAAVDYMAKSVPIEHTIKSCVDPYDFMIRHKVKRNCALIWNGQPIQRTGRYYVSINGAEMYKMTPVPAPFEPGDYKIKQGISLAEYRASNMTGIHNPEIHTKNKSKYDDAKSSIEAGRLVTPCNDITDFNFATIDIAYYISEARKLVIDSV